MYAQPNKLRLPLSAFASILVSSGCLDSTLDVTPESSRVRMELENPAVGTLSVDEFSYSLGALVIRAKPSDATFAPTESSRIRVLVSSDRGEHEELLLGPLVCDRAEEGTRYCERISVAVENDVRELVTEMSDFAGRLGTVSADFRRGVVYFFSGSVETALQAARAWDGVVAADEVPAEINVAGLSGRWIRTNEMRGGALLRFEEPTADNGVVQGLEGDQLLVEYRQPNGQVLTVTAHIECPQSDPSRLGPTIPLLSPCR